MEKVNFAKIEEALRRGVEKLQQEKLLGMTPSQKVENIVKKRANTLIFLKTWIKRIPKTAPNKLFIKRIRELDTTFTEEEWEKLDALKSEILASLNASSKHPMTDEELIEFEKERQEKKRFNVPERWIPLD